MPSAGSNPLGGDLGEQGVDLGHARLHAFGHAHGDRLLHPFERVEMRGENHARRVTRSFDVDLHASHGIAVAWRSVIFDDGVFDHEPGRCIDFDYVPGAVEPFAALGSGHEVGDRAAWREVMMLEGGPVSWRTPPPLE